MMSRQIAYISVACLFFMIASFWAAITILNYFYPPGENRSESVSGGTTESNGQVRLSATPKIVVAEASYGLNCGAKVKAGNATQVVAKTCSGKVKTCSYAVNVGVLGDPAPGCSKDFTIKWHCDGTDMLHMEIPAEANGKSIHLTCP